MPFLCQMRKTPTNCINRIGGPSQPLSSRHWTEEGWYGLHQDVLYRKIFHLRIACHFSLLTSFSQEGFQPLTGSCVICYQRDSSCWEVSANKARAGLPCQWLSRLLQEDTYSAPTWRHKGRCSTWRWRIQSVASKTASSNCLLRILLCPPASSAQLSCPALTRKGLRSSRPMR